jgi:geranylgeranyl transferase type-1 subunit beta
MALAYFVLSAIDLLLPSSSSAPTVSDSESSDIDKTRTRLTPADRLRFREWILSCQHAGGGFCGSPTMTLPQHGYEGWDFVRQKSEMGSPGAANIAATAFALILLALLGDEEGEGEGGAGARGAFVGVDRVRTLAWLRRLQREDGSFGEVLADVEWSGVVVGGGRDMRYCYFAAVLRWMLRGSEAPEEEEDIDVEGLVGYIAKSRTYDGGIAESDCHEPHSGYAYCALGALKMLERTDGKAVLEKAFPDVQGLVRWLVSRQFVYVEPEDGDDEEENFAFSSLSIDDPCVAFNGRCNKVADTCYCWWVSGALAMLPPVQRSGGASSNVDFLIPRQAARRFLMEKTQHMIGGFSKHPGGPPDMYHSYLGLAALATMGEPGLKEFDAPLAVSKETAAKIEAARDGLLTGSSQSDTSRGLGKALLNLGVEIRGERPAWLKAAAGG